MENYDFQEPHDLEPFENLQEPTIPESPKPSNLSKRSSKEDRKEKTHKHQGLNLNLPENLSHKNIKKNKKHLTDTDKRENMQSPQSPLSSPQTPPSTNDFSSFQVDQKRYENAIDGFYSTIPVLTDTIKDKQQLVSDNLNSLFTAILKKIDEVKEQTETIDQFEMLQVEEEHETSLHKGPHGGNDSSAQVDSCEDEGDSEEDGGSEDGGSEDDRRKAGEYKRKVVMEENKGEETEVHLSKKFNQLGLEIESCMKALSSSYKNLPKLVSIFLSGLS